MWIVYALLSSVFAAFTSILAKVGIDGVIVMAWGMVFITGTQSGIAEIGKKSWLFLVLSGLATGASWLCYYKAMGMAPVSKVAPIDKLSIVFTLIFAFVFLHETASAKSIIGGILIAAGTLVMVL